MEYRDVHSRKLQNVLGDIMKSASEASQATLKAMISLREKEERAVSMAIDAAIDRGECRTMLSGLSPDMKKRLANLRYDLKYDFDETHISW